MEYIIAPVDTQREKPIIDPTHLANQLRIDWNVERIVFVEDLSILSWTTSSNGHRVIGEYWKDTGMVTFHGDIEHIAEVAVWYRKIIPIDVDIHIFDDMLNRAPYKITQITDRNDIINNFS
jgi:hypothetical protein